MRTIVDQNSSVRIVKLCNQHSELMHYQTEDLTKTPGVKGFVTGNYKSLQEARENSGLVRRAPSKQTLPKSAYPEQQDGFKKTMSTRRK